MIQQSLMMSLGGSGGSALGGLAFDVSYRGDAVNGKVGGGNATADGDAIATIVDQSGNGNDGTVTGSMSLKVALFNGRNAIRVSSAYGTIPSQALVGDFTVAFVGTMAGAGTDDFMFAGASTGQVFYAEGSAAKLATNNGTDIFQSSALSPGKASLNAFLFVRVDDTLTFYQNGTARGTAVFGTGGVDLDRVFSASGLGQFAGDAAMAGVRASAFSAGEQAAFFAACRTLWGTP